MSYSIMSHYLIRSPLLPIERRNKVKGASSFEGKVAFLEDVLDDEVFVEAIEWGSPALYSQVCKFRDGCNRNDETSIDKLYYSVLKYYLRALYRATPYGLFSGIDTIEGNMKTYSEMSDGTWQCDGHIYKYRLEISGRLSNAVKDSTYIYLSNIEDITFEQAWKASGLSSNMDDYFDIDEAVLVELPD